MPETETDTERPEILLVDDGELEDLARQLAALGLGFERILGPHEPHSIAPPTGVLIATDRRAASVRRGSPPNGQPGRPIRIVAVGEEHRSTRRLLRRTGFHLVVRLPVHDEVLRLLARHALYAGDERRDDPRVAVGSKTAVEAEGGSRPPAVMLMDISNRGCRLLAHEAFEVGSPVAVEVPDREGEEPPLRVRGRVARIGRIAAAGGEPSHVCAVLFASDLDDADRIQLGIRINRWSVGPASLCEGGPGPSVPACASREIPGLTLDDETDPAIRVDAPVDATLAGHDDDTVGANAERRARTRGQFPLPIVARGRSQRRLLLGRDLSTSGMRVEPAEGISVGDRFMLALHGTSSGEPIVVAARVARDDGDAGLALRFERVGGSRVEALEKLVACLPDLESLGEGEAFGLGAVIGELIGDSIDERDGDA